MQISVNGESRTVRDGLTVAELLRELDITAPRVAVELDREIVPRAEHPTTPLTGGSKVEIVTFVGGG
jgi:sulfur carrier protein